MKHRVSYIINLMLLASLCMFSSCVPEDPIKNTPYNYIIDGPQDLYPAFSPDGSSIVYTHKSDTAKNYPSGLYVIDRNGGNRKLILTGPHITPAWSTDGKWLVFSTGGTLQKCKLDGDSLMTFTGLDQLDYPQFYYPKSSPDGKFIMFHKPLGASNTSLYRATWDFKESGSLFGLNIPSGSYPMLSPSGQRLLYVKGDQSFQSGTEIFLIDTLGTNDVRLTSNNRDDRAPFWSPDGQRIVWSGDLRITIMNADGSAQKDITYGSAPYWSVNDEIVFSHANSNYTKEVLYKISPDGTNKKQITF